MSNKKADFLARQNNISHIYLQTDLLPFGKSASFLLENISPIPPRLDKIPDASIGKNIFVA